jgi:hypothetical protein
MPDSSNTHLIFLIVSALIVMVTFTTGKLLISFKIRVSLLANYFKFLYEILYVASTRKFSKDILMASGIDKSMKVLTC